MVDPGEPAPLMTPAALLGGRAEAVTPDVVLVFSMAHAPKRAAWSRNKQNPAPFRHVVRHPEVCVVVAAGPGAPTAAITVEFLAELGARRIVSVGVAGAIDPDLAPTSLAVVEGAVSHDGTSIAYGADPARPEPASTELVRSLTDDLDVDRRVMAITTDTPLRHTAADIEAFAPVGSVIEMECAALFAAARTVGVDCASVVAISDSYADNTWKLGDRQGADRAAAEAVRTIVDSLTDPTATSERKARQ